MKTTKCPNQQEEGVRCGGGGWCIMDCFPLLLGWGTRILAGSCSPLSNLSIHFGMQKKSYTENKSNSRKRKLHVFFGLICKIQHMNIIVARDTSRPFVFKFRSHRDLLFSNFAAFYRMFSKVMDKHPQWCPYFFCRGFHTMI
jgi:hypothetical protein